MKQTDWKIIYSSYTGVAKRAIHLLSKEVSKYLIREEMVYRIYVLPCEKEGCEVSKNAFFVGCYNDSETIKKYVKPDEVPENGFLVKVIQNPEDEEGRFVILTAHNEMELFYAVVSFLDDYIPEYAPWGGSNRMPDLIFENPLTECSYTEVPDHKTRSIFTWGHSINDYRAYIDNMARVKLNELIVWNDFIPVNIADIIEYAHSYGIKVILGYSWGWKEIGNKVEVITDKHIEDVKKLVIDEYRENYVATNCDGIYFQSFTEREEESVGGKLIAEMVTDMVNEIAEELWKITPDLRLIFGLHASSVKNRLNEIAKVDKRIEILWEDCGQYPFSYRSYVEDEAKYKETIEFIGKLLELRGGAGVGFAFKGLMMLDWNKFINQHGPFVMGENSKEIAEHDRRMRANAWRIYSANWMQHGEAAAEMFRYINEHKTSEVNMCVAGTFDGGIYLPFAMYAQCFRKMESSYRNILKKVARRDCIAVD